MENDFVIAWLWISVGGDLVQGCCGMCYHPCPAMGDTAELVTLVIFTDSASIAELDRVMWAAGLSLAVWMAI